MKRSLFYLSLLLFIALVLPLLAPHNPVSTNPSSLLDPPSLDYPLGTDNLGRDVLSRTLHGGQNSLFIASFATAIATLIALILGSILGFAKGFLSHILDAGFNSLLAFPSLLLALIILTLLGRGFIPIAIATGLAQMPFFANLIRGLIRQNLHHNYIQASEAAGANRLHVLLWHLLPTIRAQVLAYTSITFAYCLINSAALSLLGLGADPSIPEWGVSLAASRDSFRYAPWALLAPATALSITVLIVNRLADSFND